MGSGKRTAPSRLRKKPTPAQRAARARNLHAHKENPAPTASTSTTSTPVPPTKPVRPAKDWKHEYEKLQRKYRRMMVEERRLEAKVAALKRGVAVRRAAMALRDLNELSSFLDRVDSALDSSMPDGVDPALDAQYLSQS